MFSTDPNHIHTYDKDGNITCCTLEEKVYTDADATSLLHDKNLEQNTSHNHSHNHSITFKLFLPAICSLLLLLMAISMDNIFHPIWFQGWVRTIWYIAAYAPVGFPVLRDAFSSIIKKDIFSEFFLMSIATIGAFAIGQYPEGVAVMLFYAIGEIFQSIAVKSAKKNIQSLIDQRPKTVTVLEDNQPVIKLATDIIIGSIIQLKPGEQVALDGILLSEQASFNTAALTGESKPDTKRKGEEILAGMIVINSVAEYKTTVTFKNSKLSRILELVQHATTQKAPTELFIRKFARIYTPIVVLLSLLIVVVPYLYQLFNFYNQLNTTNASDVFAFNFKEWVYRALIFLVISCPCALVVSIPLGYFGGIGAASRRGILFKGNNYLDVMASVKNIVMDKTGTITEGEFKVQDVIIQKEFEKNTILNLLYTIESNSTHPIATAIKGYYQPSGEAVVLKEIKEVAGQGLIAITSDNKELIVGNLKLLDNNKIVYPNDLKEILYTLIAIAYDKKFAGYLIISDGIKEDAKVTIQELHKLNIATTILSGDKSEVVQSVASELGIREYYGDLLPEDKVEKLKNIKTKRGSTSFVGDGINDAPVLALSDAGIAMGGLGSDAAIESADIVIQDDRLIKLPLSVKIGKATKKIVWQNIGMAFIVKAAVLLLGAGGCATMWEAVFADVGVALLAILNAIRIQRMKF